MTPDRLDAALVAVMAERGGDPSARFQVMVRLTERPTPADLAAFRGLEAPADAAERLIVPLVVTATDVGRLSDLPSVRSIRLAQTLRPLPGRQNWK